MKRNIDSNLFIYNLYPEAKDYFSQKTTKEHDDRFDKAKNVLEIKKNNENKWKIEIFKDNIQKSQKSDKNSLIYPLVFFTN